MKDTIHIACAPDDNYAPHCAAMLTSLFNNNANEHFVIHVINGGVKAKHLNQLKAIVLKHSGECQIHKLDLSQIAFAPTSHHLTLACYFRLFLPVLMSPSIEKVIYLDSDLLVRKPIRPLWETDLQGDYVGASREMMPPEHTIDIGLLPGSSYFNSGVLLVNLKKWRQDDLLRKCITYIQQHSGKIVWHDQHVLNIVCEKKWVTIDYTWNCNHYFFLNNYSPFDFGITVEKYNAVKSNPAIIHFTGRNKPWLPTSVHLFKDEYQHYFQLSGWANAQSFWQRFLLGLKKC